MCAFARLRVFEVDKVILVYRKGLSHEILKDKKRERDLAARKEIGGSAIGDKHKGRKQSRCAQSVYILLEQPKF